MRAQQRTSALRRIPSNPLGVQFANVDWTPAAFDGNTIKFYIWQAGQNLLATLAGCTLTGVPQIIQTSPPLMPVDAWIDGQFLVIDYGVPQGPGITLYAGPNVAEFRGPFGEYLSMKDYVVGAPVVPQNAVALSVAITGTGVVIATDGGGGDLYSRDLAAIVNGSLAEAASRVWVMGTNIFADFPTVVTPGDSIEWTDTPGSFLNVSGGGVDTFTLPAV